MLLLSSFTLNKTIYCNWEPFPEISFQKDELKIRDTKNSLGITTTKLGELLRTDYIQ